MHNQDDNGMPLIDKNKAIWFEMFMHTITYYFLEGIMHSSQHAL